MHEGARSIRDVQSRYKKIAGHAILLAFYTCGTGYVATLVRSVSKLQRMASGDWGGARLESRNAGPLDPTMPTNMVAIGSEDPAELQ